MILFPSITHVLVHSLLFFFPPIAVTCLDYTRAIGIRVRTNQLHERGIIVFAVCSKDSCFSVTAPAILTRCRRTVFPFDHASLTYS